jgi:membrane-associated protease RseP (regulator of RpoE activity)
MRLTIARVKFLLPGHICILGALISVISLPASAQSSRDSAASSAYKTTATAQPLEPDLVRRIDTGRMGFLGIKSEAANNGRLAVTAVAPGSPADKAGIKSGDLIVRFGGVPVPSPDALQKAAQSRLPGESVRISLLRENEPLEVIARMISLGSVARPLDRVRLGVRMGPPRSEGGARVEEVDADSRGAQAGIKTGDIITSIDGTAVDATNRVADVIRPIAANTNVKISLERQGKQLDITMQPAPADSPDRPFTSGRRGGFGSRIGGSRLSRDALKLAIIGIEYPDVKHNAKIGNSDWEQEFFSTNSYTGKGATGQDVFGSVNDYFLEQSTGTMRVEGKMFGWVEVSRNRMDYSTNNAPATNGFGGNNYGGDGMLLNEVLEKFTTRAGPNALANFDAVAFVYAGGAAAHNDTNVYWPHSTGISFGNRRLRYIIVCEGGERMQNISVFCHEVGHVLGLPDLYVRQRPNPTRPPPRGETNSSNAITIARGGGPPEGRSPNPYAESLGNWDVMSSEIGGGRPQHMSAWSKEQLGWIKPVTIDPMVRQNLILAPIEKAPGECFRIPLRSDGAEYLLLENRRQTGFDQKLPAEGLLIWRVVYGRPLLMEAHGLTGREAARAETARIPFPTERTDAFTPFTRPSSAAFTGDGLPVYITDIRRLADGRITFRVGHGYD